MGLLQTLGFNVDFAPHVTDVTDDTRLLRWARRRRYILVRHDRTRDKKTRMELFSELYENGGKIIQVSGNPDQDPLVAIGKLLANMDKWQQWFGENDGIVHVERGNPRYQPAEQLYRKIHGSFDVGQATGGRLIKPSKKRAPRRQKPTPEQLGLL